MHQHITETLAIREDSLNQDRREVEVTVIRRGTSVNGYRYSDLVLSQIAHAIDGARAYADHDRSPVRSVRDIVGYYFAPRVEAGEVVATLHIFEAARWLWQLIAEAAASGHPDVIGLSIDISGEVSPAQEGSKTVYDVLALKQLFSCDIVTTPSAGGKFRRILNSTGGSPTLDDQTAPSGISRQPGPPPGMDPAIQPDAHAHVQDVFAATGHSHAHAHTHAHTHTHSPNSHHGHSHGDSFAGTHNHDHSHTHTHPHDHATTSHEHTHDDILPTAHSHTLGASIHEAQRILEQAQRERCAATLELKLAESKLPPQAQAFIRQRFAGRIFETAEIDADISATRDMLAALIGQATGMGQITGMGYEKPRISHMISEAEKVQAAFDLLFDLDIDRAHLGNIPRFTGIREAYARVTGDPAVTGGLSQRSVLGEIAISEAAPIVRISEADTTTATFSYLLGTSMNKRLLKDYQAWPAEWMKFCTVVPIKDFKQQTRVRLGAFGSLPIVPEDTPYQTVSLTDTAATYTPAKRGNIVVVSREVIVNDDLYAIKQIPTKLAVAAAYTLAEFVYAFLSTNPNIYDGNPLFDATHHNNLGSSALSSSAMQSGVTAMREQTNYAGKRIGLRPRFLVVPPELEFVAMTITKSAGLPGTNNNDINPMMGYCTPIVAPQLPAASPPTNSSWYLVADPMEGDTIEIGFVGGQVNPALFIQDQPLYGLNFTQDDISYKVRHEYGGAVTDWRGLYRGI
jgi:hypothetical protein